MVTVAEISEILAIPSKRRTPKQRRTLANWSKRNRKFQQSDTRSDHRRNGATTRASARNSRTIGKRGGATQWDPSANGPGDYYRLSREDREKLVENWGEKFAKGADPRPETDDAVFSEVGMRSGQASPGVRGRRNLIASPWGERPESDLHAAMSRRSRETTVPPVDRVYTGRASARYRNMG